MGRRVRCGSGTGMTMYPCHGRGKHGRIHPVYWRHFTHVCLCFAGRGGRFALCAVWEEAMMRWMLAAVVACVLSAGLPVAGAPAHTKRQIAEDQTLIVRLAYGKLVFIQLPEPIHSVDTILPATRLMVGENSPYLSLGLVDQTLTDGRVGVYGVSGKLYILFFEQVQDKADVEIAITRTTAT